MTDLVKVDKVKIVACDGKSKTQVGFAFADVNMLYFHHFWCDAILLIECFSVIDTGSNAAE